MATFQITANAINSTYQADDSEYAILAYIRDAGYADIESAADACGQTPEQFLADIQVTETLESKEAANWRKLTLFLKDTCEDESVEFRTGAETKLVVTANDDGTFTMRQVQIG